MLTIPPAGHRLTFHPGAHLVGGQVFLGDAVFAFTRFAVDDRHAVGRAPGLGTAAEAPRDPHRMRVVEFLVAVVVPEPPTRHAIRRADTRAGSKALSTIRSTQS